jgi:cysteine desulfuration protein SufE
VEITLARFRALNREDKMQALLRYAKQLESVPERLRASQVSPINVPECQTRVDLYPEMRDGNVYFYADVDVRQSPTVAAFLSILFSVTNGKAPQATLDIPESFVREVMDGIGLAAREVGLSAIVTRVQRYAAGKRD